jgi:hypothetical protein
VKDSEIQVFPEVEVIAPLSIESTASRFNEYRIEKDVEATGSAMFSVLPRHLIAGIEKYH